MKNNLKMLRKKKNITQDELSKKAGVSRTTLSTIESGQSNPDARTISKLVKALGVPANKIFFDFDVVSKQHRNVYLEELVRNDEGVN